MQDRDPVEKGGPRARDLGAPVSPHRRRPHRQPLGQSVRTTISLTREDLSPPCRGPDSVLTHILAYMRKSPDHLHPQF
ncbi:hypothetical protein Pst134EB_023328 [Puccinia striiformis f. sp. tritici]|nr:hypothetical protein Pst134EB_023328 [Puccinia striiformis f. sp. tritici]